MKKLIIMLILTFILCCAITSGAINITVDDKTSTYIKWSWNSGITLTNLSVDGYKVLLADVNNNKFVLSGLAENETHILTVNSLTDTGTLTTTTDKAQIKSSELITDFIFRYILLIFAVIFLLIGIRVPVVAIIGFVFALLGLINALSLGDFYFDLIFIIIMVSSCCITYIATKR